MKKLFLTSKKCNKNKRIFETQKELSIINLKVTQIYIFKLSLDVGNY